MKIIIYIYILFLIFFTYSCTNELNQNTQGEPVRIHSAKNFSISKIDEGYILKSFIHYENLESKTYNYLLSSKSDTESGNNEIIHIPISRAVCLSTTHCAFISQLDKSYTIKGIGGLDYIYNDDIRNLILNKQISEVGSTNQINIEEIISLNPDVVFAYGIDNTEISSFQKLSEIGIPVIYVGDFLENTPLGRTEWIKFFACFYDNFDYACEYFDSVKNNYSELKVELSEYSKDRPIILPNLPWKGTWWVPAGNSYFANFIKDANGNYKLDKSDKKASIPLSVEEVFSNAKDAKIWLNPNQITRKSEILGIEPRLKEFEPYNSSLIYNNNKRTNIYGGNDFYESGILHPDLILKDLGIIFHQIDSEDQLYYYQKIK